MVHSFPTRRSSELLQVNEPFDRAAMDGYAVVAEDTFGAGRYEARTLRCVEKIYTGQVPSRPVSRGECIEIATGAPMPAGADAVVMVEETERVDSTNVRIFTPVYPRQHVGARAADITAGRTLLARGSLLNPSRIGALAATGMIDVEVFARPRDRKSTRLNSSHTIQSRMPSSA